jgi:hypothetical protein
MQTLNVIADALALGALGRQWAHTHESIDQFYTLMKARLEEKYPGISLVKLEESPVSGGVRFLLKEDLSNVMAGDDDLLLQTAQALLAAVKKNNPELLEKLILPKEQLIE